MPTHTLHDCYNAIMLRCNNEYAKSYAGPGLLMRDAANWAECTDEARIQARYVRANLAHWRGDEARAIRTSLDKIIRIPKR